MKTEYALNKYNLAHMGVCDEFLGLYQSVRMTYDELAEKIKEERPDRAMSVARLEKEAYPQLRKLIDIFLVEHTFVFTDKYAKIHPNAAALKRMRLLNVKKSAPLHLTIAIVSFTDFLKSFQCLVCDILLRRESYERPNISWDYVCNNLNEHIKKQVRKETVNANVSGEAKELVVYKNLSATSCAVNGHSVAAAKITVAVTGEDYSVVLPVHKCNTCGRLFVGYETLKVYEKEYGKLFIIKDTEDGDKMTAYIFKNESPLHKAGYNVIEGGITEKQRRSLLVELLKTNSFSHFEICRDIEKAIKIFEGRPKYANAVSKWQGDLMFIGEYVKNEMAGS